MMENKESSIDYLGYKLKHSKTIKVKNKRGMKVL